MKKDEFEIRDLRDKNFFWVNNEYIDTCAKLCGPIATCVYISLCRHADKIQTCFPSKKLISEEFNISERAVYTAIKILEKYNVIQSVNRGRRKDGSYKSLSYILINKTQWQLVPSATGAYGKKRHKPSANDDISLRHQVPNNNTHREVDSIKNTHFLSEGSPRTEEINEGKTEVPKVVDVLAPQIVLIIKAFESINIACKKFYGIKVQREACRSLIEAYGFDKVIWVVENILPKTNNQSFYPVITTPLALFQKWVSLDAQLQRDATGDGRGFVPYQGDADIDYNANSKRI